MPAEDSCRFRLHASPETSPYLCVISAHQRWAGHELGRWPACRAADRALIEPLEEAIAQTGTAETFWRVLRPAQQNTPERCRLAEGQKNDAGVSPETR